MEVCVGFDLRSARLAAGKLNQHQLAKLSGIDRWKIAYAETGRRELTPDEQERLRSALREQSMRNYREELEVVLAETA